MINIKKLFGLEMYVSELDTFLQQYDKTHPKRSITQQAERDQYRIINSYRDCEQKENKNPPSIINQLLD